jgi:1,4-alpha-glucan branching enzyme
MGPKLFALVLHSHIPYVLAHGSWPHGMDWLYEAAAEAYLPLLEVFERLAEEGIAGGATISFTPVLMEQLKDPAFAAGFEDYLEMKIAAAGSDEADFARTGNARLRSLAAYWEARYRKLL